MNISANLKWWSLPLMTDFEIVFCNELKSCLARILLRKFDRKNIDDTLESIKNLFKCVANEKPPINEVTANGNFVFQFCCSFISLILLMTLFLSSLFILCFILAVIRRF